MTDTEKKFNDLAGAAMDLVIAAVARLKASGVPHEDLAKEAVIVCMRGAVLTILTSDAPKELV
jgi:hypothetical protein